VQHAGHHDVVDVAPIAQRQLRTLVLGAALADPAGERRIGDGFARGEQLDGIDDLDVSGAPTQVGAEAALDRLRGRGRRPSGRSGPWPAPRSPEYRSRTGGRRWRRTPGRVGPARPGSKPSRVVTSLPSALSRPVTQLTIAFPSSSTVQQPHWPDGEHPSLGEVMPEFVAQGAEEMRVIGPDRHLSAVDRERDEARLGRRHRSPSMGGPTPRRSVMRR
jgi:hypothetical protein